MFSKSDADSDPPTREPASGHTDRTAQRAQLSASNMDALFHPRSIALIGLSSDPGKMTGAPLGILEQTGFSGEIFPVNPKVTRIGAYKCYPDVASLPFGIDVALLMLPAQVCAQAIRECAGRGIRAVVILSSGFEETDAGRQYAQDLRQSALDTGVAVVGPNCEGLWSVPNQSLLTFGSAAKRDVLHHAPIAILSQSGAMAGAVARHLQDDEVGCTYVVSVGNETVLTIADYFEWVIEQQDVRVVLLFIEGLRDGARLLGLLRRASARGIRVAALKSGNTQAGMQAAASHTGKIASSYSVYHDLLLESGVVLVNSLTELIAAGEVLGCSALPLDLPLESVGPNECGRNGVSVFSIPGGTRALTADQCDLHNVPLATFSRETVTALTATLPEFGGVENPTDLTGQVLSHKGLFDEVLQIIARDPHTEALIVQVANRGPRDIMERIPLLATVARATKMPVVASFLGDSLSRSKRATLRRAGVICARDPAEAAMFLGWLYRAREATRPADTLQRDILTVPALTSQAWTDCADWLAGMGIAVPNWRLLAPQADAHKLCEGLSFPLALKALPGDADHKTEQGLLALDLRSYEDLEREADRIRVALQNPLAVLLVQEMARSQVEVLLATVNNPDFGPVLAIGSGGVAVELWKDVAWLSLPTSEVHLRRAISGLKLQTLLSGFRGKPCADIDALVSVAMRFGDQFLAMQPDVREIEINPLFVGPKGSGVLAVDLLIKGNER